ncbi:hypothetical protein chiPu_0016434 [Chiloscyllium punctatum]|uniref:Uncharacterized protein n=1 Tax=Chiloscyllium punctatum TaxID=137246 RepID=A0A401T5Q5_CHIPU|nr:hypothetical protein [Chiloscyllium punctatum]
MASRPRSTVTGGSVSRRPGLARSAKWRRPGLVRMSVSRHPPLTPRPHAVCGVAAPPQPRADPQPLSLSLSFFPLLLLAPKRRSTTSHSTSSFRAATSPREYTAGAPQRTAYNRPETSPARPASTPRHT